MKKLFLLLPLAFLALTGCAGNGEASSNGGNGDATVTENEGGNNGGEAVGTVLSEVVINDKSVPADSGWTYVPNNPDYPEPKFYNATGSLKTGYTGQGLLSGIFNAQGKVAVTVSIAEMHDNTKAGLPEETNVFDIYGLNAAGETVATGGIAKTEVLAAGDFVATITGADIVQVKVLFADFPKVGEKCQNIGVGGAKVTVA